VSAISAAVNLLMKGDAPSPTPAEFAKARLLEVVEVDRARDGVGRWVPRVAGEFYPGKRGSLPFKIKPRWGWEPRR
jgi:hypothetical protein